MKCSRCEHDATLVYEHLQSGLSWPMCGDCHNASCRHETAKADGLRASANALLDACDARGAIDPTSPEYSQLRKHAAEPGTLLDDLSRALVGWDDALSTELDGEQLLARRGQIDTMRARWGLGTRRRYEEPTARRHHPRTKRELALRISCKFTPDSYAGRRFILTARGLEFTRLRSAAGSVPLVGYVIA